MIEPYLFIEKTNNKGRGVFTNEDIEPGVVIEESPVIVMKPADRSFLDKTLLHDYIFEWGANKKDCGLALGYISIYNHSYSSNCEYFMDFEDQSIKVKTTRKVIAGEELTINYNGDWNDNKRVWFDAEE